MKLTAMLHGTDGHSHSGVLSGEVKAHDAQQPVKGLHWNHCKLLNFFLIEKRKNTTTNF